MQPHTRYTTSDKHTAHTSTDHTCTPSTLIWMHVNCHASGSVAAYVWDEIEPKRDDTEHEPEV
jgi:hypothetical protein